MASERNFSGSFVFAVLWRALLLAVLLAALVHLLGDTQYYATALVVVLCAAVIIADLATLAARESRAAERFLDALSANALETPLQRSAIPASLRTAYDRALDSLRQNRRHQQQQGEYLQTLLDTVPAGLLVLTAVGQRDAAGNDRAGRSGSAGAGADQPASQRGGCGSRSAGTAHRNPRLHRERPAGD
jgi:hypothetical protein